MRSEQISKSEHRGLRHSKHLHPPVIVILLQQEAWEPGGWSGFNLETELIIEQAEDITQSKILQCSSCDRINIESSLQEFVAYRAEIIATVLINLLRGRQVQGSIGIEEEQ
jgi:hypothetical protein